MALSNDLLYQIALTLTPNIGDVRAKALIEYFGNAEAIFKAAKAKLEKIDGIGVVAANSIKNFADYKICESEIEFITKNKVVPLFINDDNYPKRLLHCYDSPTLLYYKGNADLNADKIIAIVGTRTNTDYGKHVCEKILEDLAQENILVLSGLAFGIDTIAHKASLRQKLKTVGILAHGLDKIYPAQNKSIATDMLLQGGLLTEFMTNTLPDRQNFPKRNRIVAGMCDALVVIESGIKGGSLITAELGNSYNKDVFALPGKSTDKNSEGCNYLIKQNKANLITSANDILEQMNWKPQVQKKKAQRELFIELTTEERLLVNVLKENENCHIDMLYSKTGLTSGSVANALLMLEMQGVVASLPGKLYKLV
jgi:DNA processing protein